MPERDDLFRDASPDDSSERRDWDLPPEVEHPGEEADPSAPRQPPAEPDEPGRAG